MGEMKEALCCEESTSVTLSLIIFAHKQYAQFNTETTENRLQASLEHQWQVYRCY